MSANHLGLQSALSTTGCSGRRQYGVLWQMQMVKDLGPKLMFVYIRQIKSNRICAAIRLSSLKYYPVISGSEFNLLTSFLIQILPVLELCLKSCGTQLPTRQRHLLPFWMPWVIWDSDRASRWDTGPSGALQPPGEWGEGQPAFLGVSKVGTPLRSCALLKELLWQQEDSLSKFSNVPLLKIGSCS